MSEQTPQWAEANIGERLRDARIGRQVSIRGLASLSGSSASSISQIERGIVTPKITTLVRVLAPLGLTVSQLLSDESSLHEPLRASARTRMVADELHHEFPLVRRAASHFEVYSILLLPGGSTADQQVTHGASQEFCLVQSGTVVLELKDREIDLRTGDTMEYLSSEPHRLVNRSDQESEVLWVVSPPSIEDKKPWQELGQS